MVAKAWLDAERRYRIRVDQQVGWGCWSALSCRLGPETVV